MDQGRRLRGIAMALAAGAFLGGCAATGGEQGPALDEVVPPGEPQRCVQLSRIDRVEPLDATTILFHTRGGDVWRNRLGTRCPGLRPDDILMYEVRSGQLCNLDTVTKLEEFGFGFHRGPTCTLGKFDFLTEDQADALKQAAKRRRR